MDRSKWEYKKLGEVATFERGLTYSKKDESDSSTKGVLRSNNIDLDSHQLVFDEIKWLNETFEIPQSKKLAKDSIFICMSNGSKTHLGKVAFIDKDYDYAFGGFMGMIKPLNIYPKYLFYYFLSKEYRDGLEQIGKGANINNLRFAQLANFMIPNPITEVQQRIVAELDCLNEMIALKQEQLKEFDKLAQSIFYDMFGDPATNEKGWELREMESLCTHIVDCPHSTPKKVDVITPYPCIRTSELKGGEVQWDTMQYLDEQEYEIRVKRLRPLPGDIVFGREGTIGDAVILPRGYNFSLGQRTMLLRVDKSVISEIFLHRTIMSEWVRRQIKMVNVSSTVAHVNIKDFKVFDIPLPPLALQQQFAEKIQAIEAQKELVKKSIAETQQLLDSRMDYYFD